MSITNQLLLERYGESLPTTDQSNETVEKILNRRVCRKYSDKKVPEGLLSLLLAAAQSAPTKSNLQQYSILVVRNQNIRRKIEGLILGMDWIATAPIFIIFLGDVRRIRKLAQRKGYNYKNNNSDTFLNAVVDSSLAMQSLIIAADSMDLGTCPVSYVRNRIDELSNLLNLPDGVFPIAGLTLGYKAEPGFVSLRLPQKVIIHYNQYNDNDLNEEVAKYDERAHQRSPISPKNQRHTEKYGVLEKCTWSENVCRQLSLPERERFFEYLKARDISLC